jgi:hypothetical protein
VVSWVDQARDIARQLWAWADLPPGHPLDEALLTAIETDPALFWLRGEEQPPGTWRPPGESGI